MVKMRLIILCRLLTKTKCLKDNFAERAEGKLTGKK